MINDYPFCMTIARKYLINYSQTRFYHCMSRCVRQGFLLDSVKVNGAHYNYRNDWVQRRLLFLADAFAIDVLSFAIMDNHTHLVLFANLELANEWSSAEVLHRWSKLGKLPLLCQLYLRHEWRIKLNDVELAIVLEKVDEYRQKLADISAFMSRFNYYIAKRANKEDKVSGHFWEARFKSQALLDANAVLSCMQYVDLNPIRAKKSTSLFKSYFTSIKYRLDNSVDHNTTQMLALRKITTSYPGSTHLQLSLQAYINQLEGLIVAVNDNCYFRERDKEVVNGEGNWRRGTLEFETIFSISAGEEKLVSLFEKQARLFSGLCERETHALSELILDRLLDSQYPFDKTHFYS